MDLYPWLVLTHIVAAFGFALSHGVSVYTSFAIRRQRDPERIRALLELSSMAVSGMYVGLGVLLIAGIAAGIVGNWFGRGWIWAALGVLITVTVAMYAIASRYYAQVRSAVGLPSMNDKKGEPPPAPLGSGELAALLDTRRPEALAAVGFVGLVVILWLMVLKPF